MAIRARSSSATESASAIGSISNIYFAATAGYFDAPAETKPLLHTWSLGVEEQFYLIAPLLMLVGWRLARERARWLFAVATVLSFVAAFTVSYRNTTFVFYLTPFRAWEPGLGALLSLKLIPAPAGGFARHACGIAQLLAGRGQRLRALSPEQLLPLGRRGRHRPVRPGSPLP